MYNKPNLHRAPDSEPSPEPSPQPSPEPSPYSPEASESLAQTRQGKQPVTSSAGETPYTDSPAESGNGPDRNVPEDGPSGENTKNNGERGGGLWTSGGQVTTGTPYHDEDN